MPADDSEGVYETVHRQRLAALLADFQARRITAKEFQDRAVAYDREHQASLRV